MDKDTIITMVQGLLNKTTENGCTEEEAQAACAKAHELLQKYQLEMFDVDKANLGEKVKQQNVRSDYSKVPEHYRAVARAIAYGFNCRLVFSLGGKNGIIHFIGVESDAIVAAYYYTKLSDQYYWMGKAKGTAKGYRGGNASDYTKSFLIGAAQGLTAKFNEERAKEKDNKPVNALIVVKNKAVNEYVREYYPKLMMSTTHSSASLGLADGYKAGVNTSLTRGIGNNTPRLEGK